MKQTSFEEMWEDISKELRRREEVETLAAKVRNRIIMVKDNEIVVRSEKTSKDRHLRKETFRPYCTSLLENGTIDPQHSGIPDTDWIGVGRVVLSIIALLPYVGYDTRPTVVFMKE